MTRLARAFDSVSPLTFKDRQLGLEFEELSSSIPEAENWLEDNYGIKASYKGQDLKYANAHNQAIKDVMEEFNELNLEDVVWKVTSRDVSTYAGRFQPIKGDLRINRNDFASDNAFLNMKKDQTEKSRSGTQRSIPNFNERTIASHELGHAIEWKLVLRRYGGETLDELEEIEHEIRNKAVRTWNSHTIAPEIQAQVFKELGISEGRERWNEAKKLGTYGATDIAEWLAQAVADYMTSPKPLKQSKLAVKYIKEMI